MHKLATPGAIRHPTDIALNDSLLTVELIIGHDIGARLLINLLLLPCQYAAYPSHRQPGVNGTIHCGRLINQGLSV